MSAELFPAIKRGDKATVEQLLSRDPELAMACEDGGTSALLTAYYYGHPDVASVILAKDPPLDIFEAAAAGRGAQVAEILDRDPSKVNAHASDGFHPLGLAAFFRRREVVSLLLARGADVAAPARNKLAVTALHSAVAADPGQVDHVTVRALLDAGAPANAAHQGGGTPLHTVAFTGDMESARLLLGHGADPRARMADGKTPIDIARERGHTDLAALLEGASA